jgi:hypothetical protein
MSDVFFEILSPLPLNRHEDARKLFQLWAENAFQFLPNRWGLYEPYGIIFQCRLLDEAIRRIRVLYGQDCLSKAQIEYPYAIRSTSESQ